MSERPDEATPLERERWLLEEQSASERARTEAKLDAGRRELLVREDRALREQLFTRLPPEQLVANVQARLERARKAESVESGRSPWWIPALLGSLAALSIGVFTALPGRLSEGAEERAKGLDLELRVYRKHGTRAEQLVDGSEVAAGDVLQVGYVRAEYTFGVLVSIDGRGEVTLHHPAARDGSTALATEGARQLLPNAYELDDAPGFERFVFVVAQQPLSVAAVEAAARELARDPERARRDPLLLPVRTAQRSLLLRKRAAP